MAKSKSGESSLLTTSIAAATIGCMAYAYSFPVVGLLTGIVGGAGILFSIFDLGDDWEKIFRGCNLYRRSEDGKEHFPRLQEKIKKDKGTMYRFNVVPGLGLNDFHQQQERIQNYLGKQIEITYNNKNFFIYVMEESLKTHYPFVIPDNKLKGKGVYFPVGYSLDGLQWLELSEESPHLLLAAMSGAGKSVLLKSLITIIILYADKYIAPVKLHLADFKYGAEFAVFRKCKQVESFCKTKEECMQMLRKIDIEINKRYELFYQKDVVNISEYNQEIKDKRKRMSYELIFIDEFGSLMDSKEKESKEILINVSQKARAVGIFLIISTQRPDAATVGDGRIKANFDNVVGMKTLNEINSRIIWDQGGLEKLRGKGHFLMRTGGKEYECQGMFITQKEVKELIKHTYKEEKQNTFIEKKDEKKQEQYITDFSFLNKED